MEPAAGPTVSSLGFRASFDICISSFDIQGSYTLSMSDITLQHENIPGILADLEARILTIRDSL